MMTHERHDIGTSGEIEELERNIAELRLARAQMQAEREEHVRNAARATTVSEGLASLHRELDLLVTERAAARDVAQRDRTVAAEDLARLSSAANESEVEIRTLAVRLADARARAERITVDRFEAERRVTEAARVEASACEQHDETIRTAADLKAKLDTAENEAALAQTRASQLADIAQTLDREHVTAEAALVTARVRYEATRLHADLARIRTLEERLASERETLERRLHDLGGEFSREDLATARSTTSERTSPNAARETPNSDEGVRDVPLFDDAMREVARVSLAKRLERDFGAPA